MFRIAVLTIDNGRELLCATVGTGTERKPFEGGSIEITGIIVHRELYGEIVAQKDRFGGLDGNLLTSQSERYHEECEDDSCFEL